MAKDYDDYNILDAIMDQYNEEKAKKKKGKKKKKVKVRKIDPREKEYYEREAIFQSWIRRKILDINKINPKKFRPGIDDYKKLSIFSYDRKPVPINSEAFRVKFLSFYLTEVGGNVDTMTTMMCVYNQVKKKDMWEKKLAYFEKIRFETVMLTRYMMGGGKYRNVLRASNLDSVFMTVCNHKEYQAINKVAESIRRGIDHGNADDIVINDILLLAYAVGASDFKFNRLPAFEELEGRMLGHNFHDILVKFGKCVRKALKKKDSHPMLYSFYNASPMMLSTYPDANTNKNLNLAILVLSYTAWMIGDRKIARYIREILLKE